MIVDSSAIVAMLLAESGFEEIVDKLLQTKSAPKMGSPNSLETTIVVDGKRDPLLVGRFEEVIEKFNIEIVPFTPEHAEIARKAYGNFGKGSGHPAQLNFGDCMAYALARGEREQLLFVGNDFTHTDIEAA